jgi:hypothetical protein
MSKNVHLVKNRWKNDYTFIKLLICASTKSVSRLTLNFQQTSTARQVKCCSFETYKFNTICIQLKQKILVGPKYEFI